MAIVRVTSPSDFATGDAFAKVLFGDRGDATFFMSASKQMRRDLKSCTVELDYPFRDAWPRPAPGEKPVWKLVRVGTNRFQNWRGLPHILIPKMVIGDVGTWDAEAVSLDIWPVLLAIREQLVKRSPKRRASTVGRPSNPPYHRAHEIWLNGKRRHMAAPGPLDETAIGQIVNRVEYSSVLETPDYPRRLNFQTYQRVLRWADRKYGNDFDIGMTFGNPDAFGGHRYTKPWAQRTRPDYAVPVITVAALNTLPRNLRGNLAIKRRRTLRQRRNPRARGARRR